MEYRKRCSAPATRITEAQVPSELGLIPDLKKALEGRLQLADVERLFKRLRNLYPDLQPPAHPTAFNPAIRHFHR